MSDRCEWEPEQISAIDPSIIKLSTEEREAFEMGCADKMRGYALVHCPFPAYEGAQKFEWERGYRLAHRI